MSRELPVRIEGYWYSTSSIACIMPITRIKSWDGQEKFLKKLHQVEQLIQDHKCGHQYHYRGWSTCRICDCRNGSTEFELEGFKFRWKWPSGFSHYISKHNVKPSYDFREFIMKEI